MNIIAYNTFFSKMAAPIGVIFGFLFGGWTEVLTILLVVQALDIITGFLKAGKNQEISSVVMRDGLITKIGWWCLLVLAHMLDLVLFNQPLLQTGVAFIGIANEGLSITENLGDLGIIVPESVLKYLKQVKANGDETEK